MTIIIFILVLSFLVFIHELGHFLIAKRAGIRVDEFAIGFPPKIFSYTPQGSETTYSLNAIPFGGYVKIYGEDGTEENLESIDASRSMTKVSKLWQIAVLSGGVVFNFILAWVLISISLMLGTIAMIDESNVDIATDQRVMVTTIAPSSPAESAGIKTGDSILSIQGQPISYPEQVINIVKTSEGDVNVQIKRDDELKDITLTPSNTIVEGSSRALGIGIEKVGTISYSFPHSFVKGFDYTLGTSKIFISGLYDLVVRSWQGEADLNELSGPVGIARMSGEAASQGIAALLSFMALLSLNLAVLNIMPFPALDGGRIVIVILESIRNKQFSAKTLQWINGAGFILLMGLMLIVTIGDIRRYF